MDVIALGEVLIDFAARGNNSNGYPLMQANPGGAPANFLAALSKYGCSTGFIGKVGEDAFGYMLEKTLQKIGVDTRGLVKTEDVFTTLAFVTFDNSGDRSFSFARKPGADATLSFEECDLKLIDEAKVFHFGTLSMTNEPVRTATIKLVEYAKNAGKIISFDPNLRAPLWENLNEVKYAMLWGLSHADVVKISDNEVDFLWDETPEQGAARIIEEYGAKLVFVTLGADGCFYMNRKGSGLVQPPKVKAIDPTGAGDIFGGSAMSRILKTGKAPDELTADQMRKIVQFASTAASLSTQKPGGMSSVPSESEVLELI